MSDQYRVREFQILRERRRKWMILLVGLTRGATTVRFIAELLAVLESGDRPRALDATVYNHVSSSLAKSHLEPLIEEGVIVRDGAEIEPGPAYTKYLTLALAHELVRRVFPD